MQSFALLYALDYKHKVIVSYSDSYRVIEIVSIHSFIRSLLVLGLQQSRERHLERCHF